MIKKLLTFMLVAVGIASAQSHTLPTLDRNNAWTGNNSFIYGKLSLNQGASCPTGQYVTGYTSTFVPICGTPGGGSGNIVSINGDTTPAQLIQGTGGITCTTVSGTTTCNYAGGAGSGNVGMANAYQVGAYPTAGTTIDGAPHMYILNPSMSTAQINTLLGTLTPGSDTVIIPDGTPQQAWNNPNWIQMIDYRRGASQVQLGIYGAVCDARTENIALTMGSNTFFGGSNFSAADIGKTIALGYQAGFPVGSGQSRWTPTITGYSSGTVTLSANAPFNFPSQPTTVGTLNTTALQSALNNSSYLFPLSIPADCGMLTGTLQWNGQSIIGMNELSSVLIGLPHQDVLQQTDNSTGGSSAPVELANFSISVDASNTSTFPTNSYDASGTLTVFPGFYRPLEELSSNANNPLAIGWAKNAYNGVAITTQNTNVICYSTATGMRAPTVGNQIVFPYMPSVFTTTVTSLSGGGCTGATSPATIGASFPNTSGYTVNQAEWVSTTSVQSTSTSISGTPTYPFNITLNNSIQPDPSSISNVASQGHIKIGSAEFDYMGVSGYNGSNVIAIRSGPTSVNGGAGYSGTSTVVPLNPCSVNYDTPWPVTPTINTGTITSYAIVSNVATFNATNSLQAGQIVYLSGFGSSTFFNNTSVTVSATGLSSSSFQVAFTHANASATENGTYGNSTPYNATYFPGLCGGNAAISFPQVNGNIWSGGGVARANIHDLFLNPAPNQGSWQDQFNTIGIYQAGNTAPYGATFNNITIEYLWGGIMQGPASAGQHGVAARGPTGVGNAYTNCTIRAAYPMAFEDMEESKIDRCDTYTTLFSPYDGTAIGGVTWLQLGYTLDEQTGALVSNTGDDTIEDSNTEPENGSHIIFPASMESQCIGCYFRNDIFEGVYNIFGSAYQTVSGGQLSGPVINYGTANTFSAVNGLAITQISNSWLNGGSQNAGFINWGTNTSCGGFAGGSGPAIACGAGTTQPYAGQSADTILAGQFAHPVTNPIGGMVTPGEWNTNQSFDTSPMSTGFTVDSTEPFWGSYASCVVGTGNFCQPNHFDGFNGFIWIGPHNRLEDTSYILETDLRMATTNTSVNVSISAYDSGNGQCTNPATNLATATFSVTTTWIPFYLPVSLSTRAGCVFSVQFGPTITGTDSIRVGGFNMVPVPQWSLLPVQTFSGACPVPGAILGSDSANMYVCVGGVVENLPFGGGGGGGGGSAFSAITSGSNTTATMTVGTGGLLQTSGAGVINATSAVSAATTPTLCSAGQAATGVSSTFNASGCTTYLQGNSIANNFIPVSNGTNTLQQSLLQDNGTTLTYGGTGGVNIVSSLPGLAQFGAGAGTIPTLKPNSYGFVGPTSGGTSYLLQLPPTITAGVLVFAAPTTIYGVNVSQATVEHIPHELTTGWTLNGTIGANVQMAGTKATNAGQFTNLHVAYGGGATCTTGPTFSIFVGSSVVGTTATGSLTYQAPGTATDVAQTGVTFTAGQQIGIQTTGTTGNCAGYYYVTATYIDP